MSSPTSCVSVKSNLSLINLQQQHSSTQQELPPSTLKRMFVKKKKSTKPQSPMSIQQQQPSISATPTSSIDNTNNDERVTLIEKLNENHKTILEARNEYLNEYKNFVRIAYKFYDEKYLNLKIKFKNQILKQQIYFESELYDISKECQRDYDYHVNKLRLECNINSNSSNSSHLYKKFKYNIKNIAENYLKLCKIDMKKLIGYMKDALINSYDTLVEAYETCHVLKLIEKLLKQNNINHLELMNENRNSFSSIQQYLSNNDDNASSSSSSSSASSASSASSSDNDEDEGVYVDEQMQIVKYKQDMENLMNTLDDIEVQYLQRKDQMQKKSKLFYQLKSKIKYIENKFENLSKEVNNLRYESCVYKHLLDEKHLVTKSIQMNDGSRESNVIVEQTHDLVPLCETDISLLATRDQQQQQQQQIMNENEIEDFSRKLHLISNLINLHKTKNSYHNRKNQQQQQQNNNYQQPVQISNSIRKTSNFDNDYSMALNLYECSCDGDLVTIENCDFKLDHDLSDWIVTRQIDNMPIISYKIPTGSICKSGKVFCAKTLFNDQLNFLYAIKKITDNSTSVTNNNKNISIRINTKLISPNGKLVSLHTQEIPQFYQEIFKYANLIGFF